LFHVPTPQFKSHLKVLVNLAILFVKQGQKDRVAELLSLARHHSASEQTIQERAERLLDEMGLVLPGSVPRSLDLVVAEALAETSPSRHHPASGQQAEDQTIRLC